MNLDLLIKLVKLANNNPNDNEANSAARRACKLIAEGNYKFTPDVKLPKMDPVKTWNDVTRSTEPEFKPRQNPWNRPGNPFYTTDHFQDMFRKMQEEQERMRRERVERDRRNKEEWGERYRREQERKTREAQEKAKENQYTHYYYDEEKEVNWDSFNYHNRPFGNEPQKKPKIRRVCTKCGVDVETSRWNEDPFVCGICKWDQYNKERKAEGYP